MGAIMVYGVSHCGKLQVSAQISFRYYGLGQTFLGDYGSFILELLRLFKIIMASVIHTILQLSETAQPCSAWLMAHGGAVYCHTSH